MTTQVSRDQNASIQDVVAKGDGDGDDVCS